MLLPVQITSHLGNLLQVLVPFQDAVGRSADRLTEMATADEGEGAAGVRRRMAALQSAVVSLAAQNRTLRREYETVTGIRGRGLGDRGRLIPARVVADDVLAWRESRLILGGTRRGISTGDGVLSRHFLVDVSSDDGAEVGMGVLAVEALVGVIVHAGTHTSRVKLLSDPATRMSVTIGRVEGSRRSRSGLGGATFSSAGAQFWLVGVGRGRMEVREVDRRYVDEGSIAIGDVVLTRDDDPYLPPSVTIGTISEIVRHPDNGLLYNLEVTPAVDPSRLRRVYVVDIGG